LNGYFIYEFISFFSGRIELYNRRGMCNVWESIVSSAGRAWDEEVNIERDSRTFIFKECMQSYGCIMKET